MVERRSLSLRDLLIAEAVAVGLGVAVWAFAVLRHLELEIVVAGVLALVIEPIVSRLVRLGLPRVVAVLVTVVLVLAALVGLAAAFVVPLVNAGQRLLGDLPSLLSRLRAHRAAIEALLVRLHLQHALDVGAQSIAHAAQLAVTPALSVASGAVGSLATLAVIGTLAVFLSLEAPKAIAWLVAQLDASRRPRVEGVLHDVAIAVAGYVLGNLATSVVAGLVIGVTYAILGLPDPALIGLWVGLVDLLPLVGGLAGGVPAVALALVGGPEDVIIVLIVVLAYQQIENHVLNPVVYAKTVRLSPLWVLVAILVGAQAASLPGALIAIPIASAIQVIARETLRDPLRRWLGRGSGAVVAQGTDLPTPSTDTGDELVQAGEGGKGSSGGTGDVGVVQQQRGTGAEPVREVGEDRGAGRGEPPVAPPA